MKKLIALLLALSMIACLFVGCGGGAEESTTAAANKGGNEGTTAPTTAGGNEDAGNEDATTPDAGNEDAGNEDAGNEVVNDLANTNDGTIKKVALVTDVGTIDDESFNQACWQGVEAWCSANGVDYTYYQPAEDSTDARVMSVAQAVNEGANVIVMPGYLFGATLMRVMEAYPEVYFIAADVGAGDMTEDYVTFGEPAGNTACMTYAEEQAGYLAGYAAVKDGYTKLGFLGGMAVPAVIRYGYGFIQGADAAAAELKVDIEINYTYGGVFYGTPEITAKMEGWYENGTEVVFACGGGIYSSAVEAANKYGQKVIGVDVDQYYIDECIITSAMKGLQNTVENALKDLGTGNWDNHAGAFTNYSLLTGEYVGLPTAEASWRFNSFTVEEYEIVKGKIASEEIVVSAEIEYLPEVSSYTTVNEIG